MQAMQVSIIVIGRFLGYTLGFFGTLKTSLMILHGHQLVNSGLKTRAILRVGADYWC